MIQLFSMVPDTEFAICIKFNATEFHATFRGLRCTLEEVHYKMLK